MQIPPPFAPVIVYLYSLLFGRRFIIDAHTGALTYRHWRWSLPLLAFLSRRSLATIVTNEFLAKEISSWGANPFVLEDPPTIIEAPSSEIENDGVFRVVMICGADPDEPVEEVVLAARRLPDIHFDITGDFQGSPHFGSIQSNYPQNVSFTGYIANDDYYALLSAADVIISLTTDDHTFQSGANESLWLSKPIITSDWDVLRCYFSQGTVHVDNTAKDICKGILTIRENYSDFLDGIMDLQKIRRQQWESKVEILKSLIRENS